MLKSFLVGIYPMSFVDFLLALVSPSSNPHLRYGIISIFHNKIRAQAYHSLSNSCSNNLWFLIPLPSRIYASGNLVFYT